jgi:branched-chain amino acid transport system substrate-binding protein
MRVSKTITILMSVASMVLLLSCQKPEPVRIGFVGGLSGRVADLGVAARNGAQLAIEQRNAAGGINKRQIELVVRDDEQNPETAKKVTGELISQNIELIIGPLTSSMAIAMMPQINASKSILLSPTVTTKELTGKDDNFLRVISPTVDYAAKSARYQYQKQGIRTVAAIYDGNNASYTESWLNDFRKEFTDLGGRVLLVRRFESAQDKALQPLVKELLSARADGIVIVANSVDSAIICQQVRAASQSQRLAMSEWAATERFIELAGKSAEGVIVSQFLDRNSKAQTYLNFLAAYRERYKQEPGFAGVAGYDAAMVAIEAYAARAKGESLKNVIISKKSYQGLQQQLNIDRYGDADRKTFVTTINLGRYVTQE